MTSALGYELGCQSPRLLLPLFSCVVPELHHRGSGFSRHHGGRLAKPCVLDSRCEHKPRDFFLAILKTGRFISRIVEGRLRPDVVLM